MTIPIVHQAPVNPLAASENRQTFDALDIICVNLIGASGAGRTSLLEAIIPRLKAQLRIGVIEGDLAATCDAQRLSRLGVPVVQALTDGGCHLRAAQVQMALSELPLTSLDLIFIENADCLLGQANTDLGEHLRLAILSVAGGDAVIRKYPLVFRDAALVLLTKCDLLREVDFDLDVAVRTLMQANPRGEVICTDTRRRIGIDRVAGWLLGYVRAQRMRRLGGRSGSTLTGRA